MDLTRGRRATQSDLATIAGVSVQTVSNAFRHPDRLRPETLASVRSAANRVGFAPNLAARALRGAVPSLLVLGVPDLDTTSLRAFVNAFDAAAWSSGFSVQVLCVGEDGTRLPVFESILGFCAAALLVRWDDAEPPVATTVHDGVKHELTMLRTDRTEHAAEIGRLMADRLIDELVGGHRTPALRESF
jgi:hypothetical protein